MLESDFQFMASHAETHVVHSKYMHDADSVEQPTIVWSIHLARSNPRAIPTLFIATLAAALLVTALFHSPIPGIIAILLITGSVKEFLFPINYRITGGGVEARSLGAHLELAWMDIRRCVIEPRQITFTSLANPSRLDVFRGVTIRFAKPGEPGDQGSVLAMCKRHIPELVEDRGASEA